MSLSGHSAAPSIPRDADSFVAQVKLALEHVTDETWLGVHSPLAAPYILGHQLDLFPTGETASDRGRALQDLLGTAAEQQTDALLQAVLDHCFFERNPKQTLSEIADQLSVADRTLFRLQRKAIGELADALHARLLPTLRPELPLQRVFIGRAALLDACLAALQNGRSVSISGAGGTGKTTLGAVIAQNWEGATLPPVAQPPAAEGARLPQTGAPRRVFWCTLRPGLNDGLSSFVFSLGYFLRTHGAANTWRQLVADQGVVEPERMLGLIRYDLNQIRLQSPLLCVDEVDTLQLESNEHVQLLHLLEELRPLAPLLLIGQRPVIETDAYHQLAGLSETEVAQWIERAGPGALTVADRQSLLERTRGHPALLNLIFVLLQGGDTAEAVLANLASSPSTEGLFNRVWRQLSEPERSLLRQLAVFRTASPQDAWSQQPLLQQLEARGVLQQDSRGALQLPPHIHRLVYERTPPDLRTLYHLGAAQIREARGEYSAAIYHYVMGKASAQAVWLWFTHRSTEISRGRGPAALELLNQISLDDLPDERDRGVLLVARSELLKLAGRAEEAEAALAAVTIARRDMFFAYRQELYGDVLEMQGRLEQALQHYRESLQTLIGAPQLREVTLHQKLSYLYLARMQNLEQAGKEALLARLKAETFYGNVVELSGDFATAQARYEVAQELAELLGDDLAALSLIYSHRGKLELKLGRHEQAIVYMEKAIACDEQRGDRVGPLYDRINLAFTHILMGNFEEAYRQARQGLDVAERMQHAHLIAGLAAATAEACYYLNRLEEAEQYASKTLEQEEEHYIPWALTVLGRVRSAQQRDAEAVRVLENAIELAQTAADTYGEAYALAALGDVYQRHGDAQRAQQSYQAARRQYDKLGMQRESTEIGKKMDTTK